MMGIYAVQNIGILFVAVLALVGAVYYVSRRAGPVKIGKEKERIFACGEDETPENLNVLESGFFTSLGKTLGISRLRSAHDGDLSNYITWIFIGMLVLIMVLVMAW
jgi:hypothetical protein